MNNLVAIVGPTATGKSRLALNLARNFGGEIISADSRQVYRYMDIGTAKPIPSELSLVRHHLVDIVNPDEDFSLAQYQHLACRAIEDVSQRHKLAFLVGGTGLYIWSVLEGWEIPEVPPDPEFRRHLEKKAAEFGKDELYRELVAANPVAAEKIDRQNMRRVIRALEVQKAGSSLPQSTASKPPPLKTIIIGLTADRAELYRRIDARVDHMMEQGLVDEVKKLLDMGYDLNLPSMSGIGYRQIDKFLSDELTLAEATQQTKFESHRFARHQYNWFRLRDDRILWFDILQEGIESGITESIAGFQRG